MVRFWHSARRHALMHGATEQQLKRYLQGFRTGYRRGMNDVLDAVPGEEWQLHTRIISRQVARDHSVVEAGCWLAGMRVGRIEARVDVLDREEHVKQRFCSEWNSEYIAECALECEPSAVETRRVFAILWRKRKPALIVDQGRLETITDSGW